MAIGIYKITNIINNKFYIGSTRRLSERKTEHNYNLRKGQKENSILRNSVLKYGYQNFKFEVLEEFIFGNFASIDYIDELITSREQYYVDELNPDYNIKKEDVTSSKNIYCCKGVVKNQLSVRETARRFPKEFGRKKIDVYERETLKFIETVLGVRVCSKKYNTDTGSILHICKNGYTQYYKPKFIFCYYGDDVTKLKKDRKDITGFRFVRKDTTPIIQIDDCGNFIKEWRTKGDAEKELGLYGGSVSRVVSGEYKHTKNYYFKYKENDKSL